jgi:hypothetical protein
MRGLRKVCKLLISRLARILANDSPLQFRAQPLRFLRIHIAHIAPAQPLSVGLSQSARRVDQRSARSHQSGSRPDHRQIRLRSGAAMFHRTQQLRIDSRQPRQRPRIQPIVLFRLSPIKRTLRACATITSCPNSLNNRLTQGECIPASSATRQRGIAPNTSRIAFGVVLSFCSSSTSPTSSSRQYQLDRSPRSRPIVSFDWETFFVPFAAAVLTFFIAGLLYLLRFERVDNLGAYSIPSETGLLIPSDYSNYGLNSGNEEDSPAHEA